MKKKEPITHSNGILNLKYLREEAKNNDSGKREENTGKK